jgi:hypothetical protein
MTGMSPSAEARPGARGHVCTCLRAIAAMIALQQAGQAVAAVHFDTFGRVLAPPAPAQRRSGPPAVLRLRGGGLQTAHAELAPEEWRTGPATLLPHQDVVSQSVKEICAAVDDALSPRKVCAGDARAQTTLSAPEISGLRALQQLLELEGYAACACVHACMHACISLSLSLSLSLCARAPSCAVRPRARSCTGKRTMFTVAVAGMEPYL